VSLARRASISVQSPHKTLHRRRDLSRTYDLPHCLRPAELLVRLRRNRTGPAGGQLVLLASGSGSLASILSFPGTPLAPLLACPPIAGGIARDPSVGATPLAVSAKMEPPAVWNASILARRGCAGRAILVSRRACSPVPSLPASGSPQTSTGRWRGFSGPQIPARPLLSHLSAATQPRGSAGGFRYEALKHAEPLAVRLIPSASSSGNLQIPTRRCNVGVI
jgi:hypothetical protein